MLLAAFLILALVTAALARGQLGLLAELEFRRLWAIFTALALQILVVSVAPGGADWVHQWVHIVSYLLAGAFLFANRGLPFLWLIGVGGLLNFIVIAANNGVMPASEGALQSAGLAVETDRFTNSGLLDAPRLSFLGDVFAVPSSWPLSNVFSIGDVCMAIGVFLLVHEVSRSRISLRKGTSSSVQRAQRA